MTVFLSCSDRRLSGLGGGLHVDAGSRQVRGGGRGRLPAQPVSPDRSDGGNGGHLHQPRYSQAGTNLHHQTPPPDRGLGLEPACTIRPSTPPLQCVWLNPSVILYAHLPHQSYCGFGWGEVCVGGVGLAQRVTRYSALRYYSECRRPKDVVRRLFFLFWEPNQAG